MLHDPNLITDLLTLLDEIQLLGSDLKGAFIKSFKEKKIGKGDLLLQEGNICNNLWYLSEGLLRSYHDIGDKEITSRIMFTGHIVISPGSFFTQTAATESIEALSDCKVASLSWYDLQIIYKTFPEFNLHARLITEQYFYKQEQRLYLMRRHDATLKYSYFLKHYANYQKLIPQKYIASFLGIAPETLSRIRSKRSLNNGLH